MKGRKSRKNGMGSLSETKSRKLERTERKEKQEDFLCKETQGVTQLVAPHVRDVEVPGFKYRHLDHPQFPVPFSVSGLSASSHPGTIGSMRIPGLRGHYASREGRRPYRRDS